MAVFVSFVAVLIIYLLVELISSARTFPTLTRRPPVHHRRFHRAKEDSLLIRLSMAGRSGSLSRFRTCIDSCQLATSFTIMDRTRKTAPSSAVESMISMLIYAVFPRTRQKWPDLSRYSSKSTDKRPLSISSNRANN